VELCSHDNACLAQNDLSALAGQGDLALLLAEKTRSLMDQQAADAEELLIIKGIVTLYMAEFEKRMELWRRMILASKEGRVFTDTEYDFYSKSVDVAKIAAAKAEKNAAVPRIIRARAMFDHFTITKYGLLFDRQMLQTIERLAGNLADGYPTLLTGEKGIAKTQAARFAAELSDEPLIVSNHGDMMSDVFTGRMEQNTETGIFQHSVGKFISAAASGLPVILDEINISDQSIVMRLQDYLLKRSGDTIAVQENAHRNYRIQPGFVVFATANEASVRYQGRNVLDPAFRDRFDIIKLTYPDVNTLDDPITHIPESLLRLALASAIDGNGTISEHIDVPELETFARLAYITEYLYSVPAKNAGINIFDSTLAVPAFLDDQPSMTDCITPRTLVEIVKKCAAGNRGRKLRDEMLLAIRGLDQAGSSINQEAANRVLLLLERNHKTTE
jgi:hypothetical protein